MGSGKKKSPISNRNNKRGKRMGESPEILGETPRKPGEKLRKRLNLECDVDVEKLDNVSLNENESERNEKLSQKKEVCICSKQVKNSQNSIECDLCGFWFHIGCVPIEKEYFEMVRSLGDIIKWFCINCKSEIENIVETNESLKHENSNIKEHNKVISQKVIDLETSMKELILYNSNSTINKDLEKIQNEIQDLRNENVHKKSDEPNNFDREIEKSRKAIIEEINAEFSTIWNKTNNLIQTKNDLTKIQATFEKMEKHMGKIEEDISFN